MNEPKFTRVLTAFSMTCRVEIRVEAKAPRIWNLLTDAREFPHWNSTITRIEGDIRAGQKIRVHVPGTERTFTPTISGVVANTRMTWTGGFAPLFKGVRTFTLQPLGNDATLFVMEERFSGLFVPLARRAMPDFGPVFANYADDLRREAERADEVPLRNTG